MKVLPTGPAYRILGVSPPDITTFQVVYSLLFGEMERQGYVCRVKTEAELTGHDLVGVDILILYRCTSGNTLGVVRLARKMQVKVIYELDDDLLDLPDNGKPGQLSLAWRLAQVIPWFFDEADLVKAGSPELAQRLTQRGFPALYRPYAARLMRLRPVEPQHRTVIGYFGTPHHRADVELIFPALQEVQRRYRAKVQFEFIGCAPRQWRTLDNATVLPCIQDYGAFLATLTRRNWTLGLAPLRDIPFNTAKSNSKFRDYSAAGIAGIYADVAPYRDSVTNGVNGWLCSQNVSAWVNCIGEALEDPDRSAKVKAARRRLRRDHNVKKVVNAWQELFHGLLEK